MVISIFLMLLYQRLTASYKVNMILVIPPRQPEGACSLGAPNLATFQGGKTYWGKDGTTGPFRGHPYKGSEFSKGVSEPQNGLKKFRLRI